MPPATTTTWSNPEPLRRVVLTEGVFRVLFAEYAAHRESDRGQEEIGWLLLGLRGRDEAIVLATLPAGTNRNASESHVLFDNKSQELANWFIRQDRKDLRLLGVVHTHPGSLRHPTSSDYRGDIKWVANQWGKEGVFGIGTADAYPTATGERCQPEPHVLGLGVLRQTWYVLGSKDRNYRKLPVEVEKGPDLAEPLRKVWAELEAVADRLNPLTELLPKTRLEVAMGRQAPMIGLTIRHPQGETALHVQIEGTERRYYLLEKTNGGTSLIPLAPEKPDDRIDLNILSLLVRLMN
ncbi:Mov34/MPN/PAD-1 family protein [Zavarzinella formosa]|uniref:Mov34/MPN/PAD-1 family protein n=1 Tax=Zavarzinella formosa TaxID=360055 RepID=UPI00037B1E90|nr:Mov34/MPN/PAD-1 family protein [Zavarzinella formosa]